MSKSLTIILTGGTGCVGFATTKALLEHYSNDNKLEVNNVSIHILDVAIPSESDDNFIAAVKQYHKVDITDATEIASLFLNLRPDVVIHTASIIPSAARKQHISDHRLWDVNVGGTKNVLDAAEQCGTVEALVYTSSCDVVKPNSWMNFVNANEKDTAYLMDAEKWDGEYARTKAAAEKLVLAEDRKVKTCAIRTHGVVGTHDQNLFPLVATSPRKLSLGSGKNLYDFSSADNVALAHLLAVDNLLLKKDPTANQRAFFVSDGNPKPFRELQEMVWREVDGVDDPKSYGGHMVIPVWLFTGILRFLGLFMKTDISPDDVGDAVATRYFDISEARKVLGYEPKKTLEESMRDACLSWRKRSES
ncbi:putative hydroxysteroid dehydrogenase [Talaromyces proteolyticus]|uniref:Hydroxysteroid dehydrogenase n=1 Tax=Talaromyces proteolyticus TaxID=1131652 RepID=A0AAD4L1Q0_9EURO|nr:putative hydroxysteroid dehydrogenase [Talaromyces proteolyticus]KAH8704011.1 putative hydroxysteroid dehydrogenase [Talaromyces proteolyticus]